MRLVIRCDADATIGLGHAGRALALAEELGERLGVEPCFVARPDPLLTTFLSSRAVRLEPLEGDGYAADAVLDAADGDAVVVSDTGELDQAALDAVAAAGVRHLVVDDFPRAGRWPCDVVVNPNLGADASAYGSGPRVGAGPRYALLRREIQALSERPLEPREPGRRVLVCLGGGSWRGRAVNLLGALAALDEAEVRATVEGLVVPAGIEAVPRSSLPEQLAWADVGVLSGGVVKYEAAAAGLPMLLLAAVEHQRTVAEAFAAAGVAEYAGLLATAEVEAVAARVLQLLGRPDERLALARRGRVLVDGRGAERAADLLLTVPGA